MQGDLGVQAFTCSPRPRLGPAKSIGVARVLKWPPRCAPSPLPAGVPSVIDDKGPVTAGQARAAARGNTGHPLSHRVEASRLPTHRSIQANRREGRLHRHLNARSLAQIDSIDPARTRPYTHSSRPRSLALGSACIPHPPHPTGTQHRRPTSHLARALQLREQFDLSLDSGHRQRRQHVHRWRQRRHDRRRRGRDHRPGQGQGCVPAAR